jgi:sec-independent protein translocase protein TatA
MIQPLFIGTTELLIISGIALLLFGGKKLPELMRGMGRGISEFKKGAKEATEPLNEVKQEVLSAVDEEAKTDEAVKE